MDEYLNDSPISRVIQFYHHDPADLKSLISDGENVNELLKDDNTYLMVLVTRYGKGVYHEQFLDDHDANVKNITEQSIMILLNAGIDVTAKDIEGRTALHMANDPNDDGMINIIQAIEKKIEEIGGKELIDKILY